MSEQNQVGLRFPRSAARVLRNVAAEYRGKLDVGLYEKAAESAERGDPLVVRFTRREEIDRMVDAFAVLGVPRPAVDELSPH